MGKFADLQKTIKALSRVPAVIAKDFSARVADQIDAQFDAGVDPYGVAWEELADATIARGRFAPPLTDTRTLRESVVVRPTSGAGVSVTFDDPGVHHQYGTKNMPARPVFPNHGMPDTWHRELADAAEAAFDRASKGGT